MRNPLPIIGPDNPDVARLLRPLTGQRNIISCSRSLWKTMMSWTYQEWRLMFLTSQPFSSPWPGCQCHRCIDSEYLFYIGKRVTLTGHHGHGIIVDIHEFQADAVIFKVVGEKVMTRGNTCYLAVPRNFASLDPVDELRYLLYRTWYPIRVLFWGEIPPPPYTYVPRELAATLFP